MTESGGDRVGGLWFPVNPVRNDEVRPMSLLELSQAPTPGVEAAASLALSKEPEQQLIDELRAAGDLERADSVESIFDAFRDLYEMTGWERPKMASLLGCKHPDPAAWRVADLSEIMHSQTILRFISEETRRARDETIGISTGVEINAGPSWRKLIPALNENDTALAASREASRAMVLVCRHLLRAARGSTFILREIFGDGKIRDLLVEDLPGDAFDLADERIAPIVRMMCEADALFDGVEVVQIAQDEGVTTYKDAIERVHLARPSNL